MRTANEHSENIGRDAGELVTDIFLATVAPGRADARAVRDLFRGLGFPVHRILTLTESQSTAAGIFRVLSTLSARGVDLGPANRVWFFHSGPRLADTVGEIARALSRTGCARRLLLLDLWLADGDPVGAWATEAELGDEGMGPVVIAAERGPGTLTAALIQHLAGADPPMTAGDLVARLAGVARAHLPPQASPMLLFPHLLDAADIHLFRRRAANAGPLEAAAIWRELVLLDPRDSDARLLQAHFETLARSTEPPS
jgi:hypothetical protein